jgi:hypothetical protein
VAGPCKAVMGAYRRPETVAQMVKEPDQVSMEAAACETAHDLIQGYLGPDHKVINV